jgi:uncharacterized phage protein (TIGR01671 family)
MTQRKIKFRGWDKDRKSMSEGWTMKEWLYSAFEQADHFEGVNQYVESFFEKLIWMQYTGLKDKNGKEIYEGDILLHAPHWDKGRTKSVADMIYPFHCGDWSVEPEDCEIIGNIYENPELLQDQSK